MIRKSAKKKGAFTLLELLVVIGIIAILAAVGIASYSKVQSQARDSRRRSDAKELMKALELYQNERNSYPTTGGGFGAYSTDPSKWENGPLKVLTDENNISALPKDPKNVESPELVYRYSSNGLVYCVQIELENNPGADPNLITWLNPPSGYWAGSWHLRFGDRAYCRT